MIREPKQGKGIPCAYFITNKKTAVVYEGIIFLILLKIIKRNILEFFKSLISQISWKPKVIICDFEMAIWNAISITFPTAQIWGCYFHLQQALLRWLKKEKLTKYSKVIHESFMNLAKQCETQQEFDKELALLKRKLTGATKLLQYLVLVFKSC